MVKTTLLLLACLATAASAPAAGLRTSALLLPCPAGIGAQGCLAVPAVLDEKVLTSRRRQRRG